MKPEELTAEMESCRRLFVQNRTDEALRLSGEILAEADGTLRKEKDTASSALFTEAASLHADMLRATGMNADAFSVALLSMTQAKLLGKESEEISIQELSLASCAFVSFDSLINTSGERFLADSEAVREIASALFTLLYILYCRCNTASTQSSSGCRRGILETAYGILSEYNGRIPLLASYVENPGDVSLSDIYALITGKALSIGILSL